MTDFKNEDVWLMQGDCLERMKEIPDGSVDMVLCDPPYGTTACKWDCVVPLNKYINVGTEIIYEKEYLFSEMVKGISHKEALEYFNLIAADGMWEQLKRIIKPNGAIVMTASQPFTTTLISSNIKMFKYCWVWEKNFSTNFLHAKRQPLRKTEDIIVWHKGSSFYYPIKTTGHTPTQSAKGSSNGVLYHGINKRNYEGGDTTRYPTNIIKIDAENPKNRLHPTQKPIALMEYLIKTYTNEGETVLDFTFGSGSTIKAAKNLNRKAIGIEMGQCEKKKSKYYGMDWTDVLIDQLELKN